MLLRTAVFLGVAAASGLLTGGETGAPGQNTAGGAPGAGLGAAPAAARRPDSPDPAEPPDRAESAPCGRRRPARARTG